MGGGQGGGVSSRGHEPKICVSRIKKQKFTFSRFSKIEVVQKVTEATSSPILQSRVLCFSTLVVCGPHEKNLTRTARPLRVVTALMNVSIFHGMFTFTVCVIFFLLEVGINLLFFFLFLFVPLIGTD